MDEVEGLTTHAGSNGRDRLNAPLRRTASDLFVVAIRFSDSGRLPPCQVYSVNKPRTSANSNRIICNPKTGVFRMGRVKRAAAGFLLAPALPGALLYVYGLAKGYGTAAIVGPLLIIPFAYFTALVIGIPAYRWLDRKRIRRLRTYLFAGALIGAGFDLLTNLPAICSGQSLPVGVVFVATVYATLSAGVFWALAVRAAPV